ncbi:alpha/beta fold hydrolase [Roseibacillus persicicus]|uniref:alpha/beta fold hydrolase n=1 Tax=Roseibacillus persicicus TaxID=454148 RepID=UPI00280FA1A2|nr:alpha/beta hydrolase [Roseibacillus persicicus]MDQ8190119.1 alpha/beta hydrolase [Roseibacillus persicicus]
MKNYLAVVSLIFALGGASLADPKSPEVQYDKELTGFEYPFEVSTFQLASQNQKLEMRYMDVGDQGSDKAIVLLHGKNFSGYYWERVANDLVKRGYRVIIPDQIGFGKSSKPRSYQYSLRQLALNTKSLLDSLELKEFDLVGHSMGGMVATTFAADYPALVKKLILINPIGLESYGKYVDFKDIDFFYQNELAKTVDGARAYQQKNYYDGKWVEAYEELLTPLKGQLAGEEWEIVAWNNALTYGPIFSESIVEKFPLIENPTFLIIGTRDTTGPGRGWKKEGVTRTLGDYKELGKHTQSLIKGSKLYELEGLGHMPQFEDYPAFDEVFEKVLEE